MTLGTFSAIRLTSHHVFVNCNGKHYVAKCIGTTSLRHWSQCHKTLQKRSQALPYNVNLENLTSRHFPLTTKTRQRGLRFLQPLYELSVKPNISALAYIFPFLLVLFYDIQWIYDQWWTLTMPSLTHPAHINRITVFILRYILISIP